MKRTFKLAAPFALAGIMGGGTASAADDIAFVLNWTTTGEHAPVFYAQSQGWYAEAGLNVRIDQGQGSGAAAQRVGAAAVDMGIADLGTAMIAKGAGADLIAVMNIYAKSPYQFYWLASSGITGLEDFEGRRFGNPPGDAARAMWPALAGANDIQADSIAWVNIAPSAKVSALASGAIDGTTFFANYHHVMEAAFGDDLRWFAWSEKGVNPYGNSVIVNGKFLEENRDAVDRMVAVLQRAHRYCAENGQECVAVLPEFSSGVNPDLEINNWNVTIDLMTDEVSTTQGLGYFDAARVAEDYALVNRYFDIREPFDPASFFTNEFIDTSITMIEQPAE